VSGSLLRMPGHLKSTLALLSCVFAVALAAPAQASPTEMERRLVEQINDVRDSYGLRKLRIGSTLADGAHDWSRHLLRRDSFHHSRLRAGTGEVLARGTCSWFRPRRAVRMWLDSPGHRALLLRPGFRSVGTGWMRGPWRGYGCAELAVARFR
jgi:uncharacterized protein YkwD